MTLTPIQPAASYKFNSFEEIKSHSSILYNERMAILFYMLDMRSIELNKDYDVDKMNEVRSIMLQIYKNVRTLIRNNPIMRSTLNLETKDPGIYVTDVALGLIDQMVQYCQVHGYTVKQLYIITQELNRVEILLKDILQYFNYFIRPDFRQKPDIEVATQQYKIIADKKTIEELREVVGKNHGIDFESLGQHKIELNEEILYDSQVDDESYISPDVKLGMDHVEKEEQEDDRQ